MIWPLIKLDLRKTLPTYLVLLIVQLAFVLFTRDILDSGNVFLTVVALVQGWMLAYRIFRDAPHTRSFLFSRPWSRARMFWQRWALGLALQSVTVLLVYLVLVAGARTLLYQRQLPYFPMVERFELSILWPIALASVTTFHIVMFLSLWGRLANDTGGRRTWHAVIIKIALVLILMTFLGGQAIVVMSDAPGPVLRTGDLAFLYAIVVVAMCTAASLNCCKHMEIES